jgi:hypothetical protein
MPRKTRVYMLNLGRGGRREEERGGGERGRRESQVFYRHGYLFPPEDAPVIMTTFPSTLNSLSAYPISRFEVTV